MKNLLFLAAAIFLSLVFSSCKTLEENSKTDGGKAANFALKDDKGATRSLKEFDGKVVVLAFWATWCSPCKEEMAALYKMKERIKHADFVLIFVNADAPDKQAEASAYISSLGQDAVHLFDPDGTAMASLNPGRDIAFSAIIGKTGNVFYAHNAFSPGAAEEIEQNVLKALNAGKQ